MLLGLAGGTFFFWWLVVIFCFAERSVLLPPLLSLAAHFGPVRRRANLDGSSPDGRVLRHQLDGVVQIPGFEDEKTGQLFLRLRIRTICDGHFSVLKPHGSGVLSALEPFPANDMAALPKLLVVGEKLFHGSFPLAFGHCFPIDRTQVRQTYVFHSFLSFDDLVQGRAVHVL